MNDMIWQLVFCDFFFFPPQNMLSSEFSCRLSGQRTSQTDQQKFNREIHRKKKKRKTIVSLMELASKVSCLAIKDPFVTPEF